ncbi:MAG: type I glyceraldehyde-3-phosphate dehydrogenase [archaeon]
MRVAINGFGRIGRMVLRAGIYDKNIDFVAINDLGDTHMLSHLLHYDSAHGPFEGAVETVTDGLIINGKHIRTFSEKDVTKLPWGELHVDVVVEATGIFLDKTSCQKHIDAGAKKVLITAPAKDPDFFFVKGVNEHLYDRAKHHIVTNESCTTNCFAPMAKVINDNYGIINGFMLTVHAYTADQNLVDGPHRKGDLRRARAAGLNIVPTSSGAAKALGRVIPELNGKVHAEAFRVPISCGSVTYFTCKIKKQTTAADVNTLFRNVANFHLKGILQYSEEDLVVQDIVGRPYSCIFDSKLTEVNGDLLKVVGWYDNEWGYSCRVVDVIKLL